MAGARCFCGIPPTSHPALQAYLLAVILGQPTNKSAVAVLVKNAACFGCLTPGDLDYVEPSVLCAIDQPSAGCSPSALTNAAKCFCGIPRAHHARLQTYLLTVAAGLPTDKAGVKSLMAAAACFLCLPSRMAARVLNYLLCQVANASGVS